MRKAKKPNSARSEAEKPAEKDEKLELLRIPSEKAMELLFQRHEKRLKKIVRLFNVVCGRRDVDEGRWVVR